MVPMPVGDPDIEASRRVVASDRFGDLDLWRGAEETIVPFVDRYTLPRFSYWKFLLDWGGGGGVLLADTTLGQDALSLAAGFEFVLALLPDRPSAERVRRLAAHHGASNLHAADRPGDFDPALLGKVRNVALHGATEFGGAAAGGKGWRHLADSLRGVAPHATSFYASGRRGARFSPGEALERLAPGSGRRAARSAFVVLEPSVAMPEAIIPARLRGRDVLVPDPLRALRAVGAGMLRRAGGGAGLGEFRYLAAAGPTFLGRAQALLPPREGGGDGMKVDRIAKGNPLNANVFFSSRGRGSGVVARIPLNGYARGRSEDAYRALERLRDRGITARLPLPSPEGRIDVAGEALFLETRIEGRCVEWRRRLDDPLYRDAADWISRLHRDTMVVRPFDAADAERLVLGPAAALAKALPPAEGGRLQDVTGRILRRLRERPFPFVFSHGDFKLENILFRKDLSAIAGVIDWDLALEEGPPVLDLMNLLLFHGKCATGRPYESVLEEMIRGGGFRGDETALASRYLAHAGLAAWGAEPALRALYWLHHVARRFTPYVWTVPEWRRRNVEDILPVLSDDGWWKEGEKP